MCLLVKKTSAYSDNQVTITLSQCPIGVTVTEEVCTCHLESGLGIALEKLPLGTSINFSPNDFVFF